jgi:hypothetical protein
MVRTTDSSPARNVRGRDAGLALSTEQRYWVLSLPRVRSTGRDEGPRRPEDPVTCPVGDTVGRGYSQS